MIRAVIFDLDGTILDTLDDLTASVNGALKKGGMPLRSREEIRHFVGNGTPTLIARSVPAGTTEEIRARTWKNFIDIYAEEKSRHTRPYDGIAECVQSLLADGNLCAVLSNKDDDAVRDLCAQYFPGVFTDAQGRINGTAPKPDPGSLLILCERLGVKVDEAVYIGDSEVDVQTAQACGMRMVGVTWGFRDPDVLREVGCTVMVDTPAALYERLKAMTDDD